jgi:peptide/nickel transport system substrate-binding protein
MDRSIPHRLLILLAALAVGCGPGDDGPSSDARTGGTIVACVQHVPQVLNPFVSPDQASVSLAPLVFTTLVRYADPDGDGPFVPGLAAHWEWDPERRAVRFRLRDDLRWHDGEPVTAADVVWTLGAASDPAFTYWNASDFTTLAGVDANADGEVEVRFTEPYGPGLEPFAILPILPHHLLADVAPDTFPRAGYHRDPVGSGPYVFRGRTAGNQLVFERSPYDPDIGGTAGGPARIVVKEIPELSTLLVELRTGVTDLCLTGPSAAREASTVSGLQLIPAPPPSTQVLLLDHRSPFFERAEARRAISAAIDRRSVAAVVSPLATPARTLTPGSWPAPADSLLLPDAAPALTDSLLRTAGWMPAAGGNGWQRPDGTPFEFTLLAPQGFEPVLTVLQDQLARAGIRARPRILEGSTFIDVVLDPDRRPPAMVLGLAPSRVHAPDPRSSLHSTGGTNLGGYQNPIADSLIDALARAAADDARASLYTALQALVATDAPLVHLLHLPNVVITGAGLEGVVAGPAGVFASAPHWRRRAD